MHVSTVKRPARPRPPLGTGAHNRGAALVVGLIILALITVLALGALRGTTLEERMAGNLKEQHEALQAAEAALQAALTFIRESPRPPTRAPYPNRGAIARACQVSQSDEQGTCPLDGDVKADWLTGDAVPTGPLFTEFAGAKLGQATKRTGTDAWDQPRVLVLERYDEDETFEGASAKVGIHYYTVSSIATGRAGVSRILLQTTIPRVFSW